MTKNMTVGNPAKLILFFTIPLLIGNLFQQLYNMADTPIVGRTIGVDALAAVGCTSSIMFLILGFTQGLTAGLSIVTAQRFGAGDEEGVRRSFAAGILIGGVITVFLTALSVALARPILILMRTPANIIDGAYSYIVIIYAGIAAAVLFNLLSSVLRALGDSRTPLIFLVIACLINIGLDFLCILTFQMGVAGAAVATIAAQLLSGGACIVYIARRFPCFICAANTGASHAGKFLSIFASRFRWVFNRPSSQSVPSFCSLRSTGLEKPPFPPIRPHRKSI